MNSALLIQSQLCFPLDNNFMKNTSKIKKLAAFFQVPNSSNFWKTCSSQMCRILEITKIHPYLKANDLNVREMLWPPLRRNRVKKKSMLQENSIIKEKKNHPVLMLQIEKKIEELNILNCLFLRGLLKEVRGLDRIEKYFSFSLTLHSNRNKSIKWFQKSFCTSFFTVAVDPYLLSQK